MGEVHVIWLHVRKAHLVWAIEDNGKHGLFLGLGN